MTHHPSDTASPSLALPLESLSCVKWISKLCPSPTRRHNKQTNLCSSSSTQSTCSRLLFGFWCIVLSVSVNISHLHITILVSSSASSIFIVVWIFGNTFLSSSSEVTKKKKEKSQQSGDIFIKWETKSGPNFVCPLFFDAEEAFRFTFFSFLSYSRFQELVANKLRKRSIPLNSLF